MHLRVDKVINQVFISWYGTVQKSHDTSRLQYAKNQKIPKNLFLKILYFGTKYTNHEKEIIQYTTFLKPQFWLSKGAETVHVVSACVPHNSIRKESKENKVFTFIQNTDNETSWDRAGPSSAQARIRLCFNYL